MKKLAIILLFLLILPNVLAIDLIIEKKSSNEVVIKGLNQPATFNLAISNQESGGNFKFFNLLGFVMEPSNQVYIGGNKTEDVQLIVYPREDLDVENFYTLQYFIRAQDNSELKEKVTLKLVDLKDAFEIGSEEIDPESNSIKFYIYNKEKFNFKDLNVKFSSKFFEDVQSFDLGENERKDFTVQIDKEDFKELTAGFYTLTAEVSIEDINAEVEGIIKFVEKNIVESSTTDYGLVVSTKVIQKTNQGNAVESSETVVKKNVISRLFTTFSIEPDLVDREGFNIYYTWDRNIRPGETLEIKVKTNWLFPFIIIGLVLVIVFLVKKSSSTDILLQKKVNFVRAKGGEFALKVTINATAKNYVERIKIIDRLPGLMKLYEKFGVEKPTRINEKARLMEWEFEKLEAGEIRTITYIIYSKNVGVMGTFALPSAVAIYSKNGEIKESESNKAYFVAEQRTRDNDK